MSPEFTILVAQTIPIVRHFLTSTLMDLPVFSAFINLNGVAYLMSDEAAKPLLCSQKFLLIHLGADLVPSEPW